MFLTAPAKESFLMTVKGANAYLQSQGYYEKTDFTILSIINLPRIVYVDLLGVYWYQIINELQNSPQNHDPAFERIYSLLHTSFNQQSPNTQFIYVMDGERTIEKTQCHNRRLGIDAEEVKSVLKNVLK